MLLVMLDRIIQWVRSKINTHSASDSEYDCVTMRLQAQNELGDRNMTQASQKANSGLRTEGTPPSSSVRQVGGRALRLATSVNPSRAQKVQDAFVAARKGNGVFGHKS